ncbi:DUF2062 domain-containing protein [Enhygromyxa salina]|uniref:DUF2062 domain-containing protein n=1 Tax=Enhygromyxa salina TaxID=215803 RepID=A0A2S9YIE8_9BACT|nr:DUF2062 domain-containing protein [Enhygromyxa salina]PRQ04831.1 hypothetical protein ENSA7_50040 [Enhygromyxa salina]
MLARLRQGIVSLLRLNASPHGIALGFTLGLGLSLFPIPLAGMFAALALAPLLGASLPAVYAGTAIVNPLTGAAIYFAELWLGSVALSEPLPGWAVVRTYDWRGWWELFSSKVPAFLLGAAILMTGISALCYPILRRIVAGFQRRHPPASVTEPADPPASQ